MAHTQGRLEDRWSQHPPRLVDSQDNVPRLSQETIAEAGDMLSIPLATYMVPQAFGESRV